MAVLFTFNLQIKFARSKGMASVPKLEMGHVTLTTSTWGIVIQREANTSRGQPVYNIWNL